MIAVDTNVLVFAHREETEHHERALQWLRHLAEGGTPWALPVFCLGEFLRLVTHRRVFDPPTPREEATAAVDGLMASPSVRLLCPGARFWALLSDAVAAGDVRGNLVFDAQIVAVCREHGVDRLLSEDRDFARFPGLTRLSLSDELV